MSAILLLLLLGACGSLAIALHLGNSILSHDLYRLDSEELEDPVVVLVSADWERESHIQLIHAAWAGSVDLG